MKKRLLSFVVMLIAISGWSQNGSQNDYSVSINGNKITTTANFKRQVEELKKSTNKQSPKTEYTLLQFAKIPSLEEQQSLKKQGITLLNYLSNNAYYASVNSQFYARGTSSDNIRTKIAIDPKYKLDPTIALGEIPNYALEGNAVKVVISYFKGADNNVIEKDLAELKASDVRNSKSFNTVYLSLSKEKLLQVAKLNWVQNIELVGPPMVADNQPGRSSHKANVLSSNIAGLGYGLTGNGVKVGLWDGNLEKHKDHTGRGIIREYEYPSSHGEHTSGTIGGAGLLDPKAKGMAPGVQIYGWNFNVQSNGLQVFEERDLAAKNDGVEITSNSYGSSLTSGYNLLRYSAGDKGDDDVTVKYPYLLNVYSNGNSQSAYPGGFSTSTKCSKNALHVAANDPNDRISNYSSFGPTIDGRLVPQIAAVGSDVYSLDYSNGYQVMSGTSMATPGTTGTLALLYERYKSIYNGNKPLASMMKALVCNTAKDVGNPGPDYKYGFGNLNGLRAIKALDKKQFFTASVANAATYEKEIVVPAGLVGLKVMLAYSDLGTTAGANNILVNNLDIKIVKDGVTTLPWILNAAQPNANATRGVDNLNNIEQITLDNPAAGTYKIIVTGANVPLDTQEFSVVYDYVAPELILTYPIGGEKFNPDTTEYIRWDYEGEAKTFTIEYSLDGGLNYVIIASNIPADARNFVWTVPAGILGNAKVRVSAGTKVMASKETFTIMTEPKNLVIAPAVCGTSSFMMSWDAIVGAKYEVLKLNGFKFDVVATVTTPTYTFDNLTAGDDNWFTVRAIDVATGIASERARAVNVEPIVKPVLTAVNIPFKETFNERKATNFTLSKASATGTIGYEVINPTLLDGVKMSGSGTASPTVWVASTTANAFANNPSYIKRLSFCDIDGTSLTGKIMRLKFNLVWNSVGPVNKNFFRLLVNGTPVNSADGVSVYGGAALTGNTVLTYDLSAYAGTSFSLAFEGVLDNDATTASPPVYSNVSIDNVEMYEATATDLALTSFVSNTGLTAAETVTMKVYNYSPVAVTNIPVSYKINAGAAILETMPGPIAPLSEATYNFTQKADFSAGGVYTVLGNVNYVGDAVAGNNSKTNSVTNSGSDISIGSVATVTTCSAVFTDNGTRFANYPDASTKTTTFKPATAGNSIKVVFSEYATEAGWDFLYIYNGPTAASPLLGKFDTDNPPTLLTSTATGGELTFKFVSDSDYNESGWIANISCVPAVAAVSDSGITYIVSPDVLGKKTSTNNITIQVKNYSAAILTNVPVFYQVNGGAKVTDVIPTIASLGTATFTFATTADLSIADAKYTIVTGVDQVDGDLTNNTLTKDVYNKNALPVHTNTDGYAVAQLKWNDVVNPSGTTAYSDFKNIKIPVYAGFTYQPEVTIAKSERPITRDQTANPGVFTMIVIDLNGDGNVTDEFYAGTFWVNTLNTATAPGVASTLGMHYFRDNITLAGGLTIPANTTAGQKMMRVIHMYRAPGEYYNVNLGPTIDGLTSSRPDFEVEEYTINVLPFTAADASVGMISSPIKPGMKPIIVSAVVRNYSNVAITNFPIAYKINGGAEVVETFTASIAAGATATYSFATKADLSVPNDYSIAVYTKLVGDTDATNDSKIVTFSHAVNYATNVTGTFDGVDDYIVSSVTPALDLTNNFTFEAWINQKKPSVFGRILDKSKVLLFVCNEVNHSLYKENSLVLSVTGTGGAFTLNTGLNSVKQNKWHHVAISVNATNVYTIYIDGVSVPYTLASGSATSAVVSNAAFPAFIGNNAGLARGFNGNIDEIRIWSGVRDQATIAANAMTKYVGNEAGLLAYYSFAEGDKQFVYDTTTNDNTAVVTNANTNGLGEGKFWNVPVLMQKLDFVNQLSSSYDANTKTYTVLLNDGASVTTVVANFSLGMNSIAKIGGVVQVNGVTSNDYTSPVTFMVEGVGFNAGISEVYTIKVLTGLSNESKLLSYDFKTAWNPGLMQEINTVIVGGNAAKALPYGFNVSNLRADFTVSPGAELFIDGIKQLNSRTIASDYTNSYMVTVVSENKLSQTNYMVTLNTKEANIIAYSVSDQIGTSVIDAGSKTVKVLVNNNANLSALVPVFQVSDLATLRIGTSLQNSGVTALNYTAAVGYNVLAQNGAIDNWTVIIERVKPIITLLGDAVVSMNKGCVYTESGFAAKDNLNADIAAGVVTSGAVDVNIPGQYTLTYTAKDALNNTSSVTRTVNVLTTACSLGVVTSTIDGFVIYPNPVKDGKVNIITRSNGDKNIGISDMSGKKVLTLQTANEELNLPNLPKGVYILKVEQDGKTSTQKLIVE
jgi:hypothetical protein